VLKSFQNGIRPLKKKKKEDLVLSFLNWLSANGTKTTQGQGFLKEGKKEEELFLMNGDQ